LLKKRVSRFFYPKNKKIEKEQPIMAKTKTERIASIEEQIAQLEKRKKEIVQKQKEVDR
jgi:hypothetical protein